MFIPLPHPKSMEIIHLKIVKYDSLESWTNGGGWNFQACLIILEQPRQSAT